MAVHQVRSDPNEQALVDALVRAIREREGDLASQTAIALANGSHLQPGLPRMERPSRDAMHVVVDVLASAVPGPRSSARKVLQAALARCSDIGQLGSVVALNGLDGVEDIGPRLYNHVRPALATRFDSPAAVWRELHGGSWLGDAKVNGWECQVHYGPQGVRLFSRTGREQSRTWRGLAASLATVAFRGSFIVEAEAVAVEPDSGVYLPHTDMARPGILHRAVGFDLLLLNGSDWTRRPCEERIEELRLIIQACKCRELVVSEHRRAEDLRSLEALHAAWLSAGYEGSIFNRPLAPYEAGERSDSRVKVKPFDNLDAVLVAYNSRSDAYLAAVRDTVTGELVPFAWVSVGITAHDRSSLAAAKRHLATSGPTLGATSAEVAGAVDEWLMPSIVAEIGGDCIQPSLKFFCGRREDGRGWTLFGARFARVREDKPASDCSTVSDFLRIRPEMGVRPPRSGE